MILFPCNEPLPSGTSETLTPEVCYLCPVYSVIWLWSLAENPSSQRQDVGNGSKVFRAFFFFFFGNFWIFCLILIQTPAELVSETHFKDYHHFHLQLLPFLEHGQVVHFSSSGVFCGWKVPLKLLKAETSDNAQARIILTGPVSSSC